MHTYCTCWDNNDLCQKTLSGHGITHYTNGVALCNARPLVHILCGRLNPKHKEVIDAMLHHNSEVLPNRAGTQCGPPKSNVDASLIGTPSEVYEEFWSGNFAWLLARFPASESTLIGTLTHGQNLPSWSTFNAGMQSSDKQRVQSTVAYRPVIGASPTQLDTVYTLFSQSLVMTK